MHSIVHLILHHLEEHLRGRSITVVIYGCSIDVCQLLIKATLREPNLPDLCQQMLEIVLIEECAIFHSFLVEHIATNGILSQYARSPLTELSGTDRVDTIAYADNGIEIVELKRTIDIPVALASNYRNFLGSCLLF